MAYLKKRQPARSSAGKVIRRGRATKLNTWFRKDASELNGPVIVRKPGGQVVVEPNVSAVETDARRHAFGLLRAQVLWRDGYRCRYCKVRVTDETANIDHVKPWKLGGQTVKANLVTACVECNRLKGNKNWKPIPLKKMPKFQKQAPRPASPPRRPRAGEQARAR